jgi:histidine triad (HIT) family protein
MSQMSECLFCRIAAGEIPAQMVFDGPRTLAFRDIDPKAPVHVLVIPREHHPDVAQMSQADPGLAAELLATIARVAEQEGLADGGFRTVFNTGQDAGQSVAHVHAHVLGGRSLSWPPG